MVVEGAVVDGGGGRVVLVGGDRRWRAGGRERAGRLAFVGATVDGGLVVDVVEDFDLEWVAAVEGGGVGPAGDFGVAVGGVGTVVVVTLVTGLDRGVEAGSVEVDTGEVVVGMATRAECVDE